LTKVIGLAAVICARSYTRKNEQTRRVFSRA
jgi:uncharacterized membrane protein YuzA (DUF378 family)